MITVLYWIDTTIPDIVSGDPSRLKQVLNNLIANAIKFTPEGGLITVRALAKGGDIGERGSIMLRFEVEDTGIGITPEQKLLLFQPFSQADVSSSRKYAGTGLGLSICKDIVEMCGGKIAVDSIPGKGSKFFFTIRLKLPLEAELQPYLQQSEQAHDSMKQLRDKRVCIMHTSSAVKSVLRHYFEAQWHMLVIEVSNSLQAIHQASKYFTTGTPLDLLVVDLDEHDPYSNHFISAHERQNRSGLSHLKIVALTSNVDQREEPHPSDIDVVYLRKPIRESKLLNVVSKALLPSQIIDTTTDSGDNATAMADQHSSANTSSIPSTEATQQETATPASTTSTLKTPATRTTTTSARRNSLLVLLAEDNIINSKICAKQLKNLGHQCEVANNGLEVLAMVKTSYPAKRFDVILMDVQMPEMDGFEATMRIRQMERESNLPRSPIIALTADVLGDVKEKCFASGMDDYLAKPVNVKDLNAKLLSWAQFEEDTITNNNNNNNMKAIKELD